MLIWRAGNVARIDRIVNTPQAAWKGVEWNWRKVTTWKTEAQMEDNIKMDLKVVGRLLLGSSREPTDTLQGWHLVVPLSHCQWRWSSFTVSFLLCYSCWEGTSWVWIDGLHRQHIETRNVYPLWAQGLLIIEASGSHSDTHSLGFLWTRDQPVSSTSTWQHTALTADKHPCSPGGIQTSNLSKRAAADPRLRPYNKGSCVETEIAAIPDASTQRDVTRKLRRPLI